MRIKGLMLLAVMVVVTVIYLAGEHFGCSGCSGRSKLEGEPAREVPAASAEKR